MKKPPRYGGKGRHELVAQAATAVRSNFTIELAFNQRHLRCRKPVHPQVMEVWGIEPQSNVNGKV